MADKTYKDFSAGTYNTSDIILTANPATGLLKKLTLEQLLGYKSYKALVNQEAADPMTINVIGHNTIGNIVWSFVTTGQMMGTLVGAFPANKTICKPFGDPGNSMQLSIPGYDNSVSFVGLVISVYRGDSDTIYVETRLSDGTLVDMADYISGTFLVEIEVYP